ncbi:WD repeat-containing protein 27 isoform X4 [Histomonas meleagridis]|uniref:WD repeat-containing protein 27 isoform X4 n=1 Tax=Histomonas meleagridis TaxID=135588 RepID=UPI00355A8590|nr:WD repeat-containing protein 27 isoform X4 [Histomonas meleagridis]KAH0800238.1 WD repeat-containing protein 27 isoform X4 [Histomonas meleagridis]
MKRCLQVNAEHFSVLDDEGTLALTSNNNFQVIDVESNLKQTFNLNKSIKLIQSSQNLTLGTDGATYVMDNKSNLTSYLFPIGYENSIPTSFSYSASKSHLSISVDNIVLVYDLTRKLDSSLVALLQGHDERVVKCSFLTYPGYEHMLVTCGEDSRFIVWDLNKRCICYESPYESSFSIKAVSVFSSTHYFALTFEDGYVRLYDPSPIINGKPSVSFVKMINVSKIELEDFEEEEEQSIIISKVKPIKQPKPSTAGVLPPSIISADSASVGSREYLLCATSNSIIALNIATFEKFVVTTFDEEITEISFHGLVVASKSSFSTKITIQRISIGFIPEIGLKLFPEDPPPENSILMTSIQLKTKQTTPIATLHKNVKSSGYAKKPPSSRFTNKKVIKKPVIKKNVNPQPLVTKFSPHMNMSNTFTPFEVPIYTAALSADGKRLICADNNGTIVFVKSKSTPAYIGHSQLVTSLSWNTKHGFLSSSLDRTVKIWDIDRPDPLLTINKTKSETRGTPFTDDVTFSSFFWNDKFIVLSYGKTVALYGYHLPSLSSNAKAISEMHQTGTYKNVHSTNISSGKIVSMSASNLPSSPIVLVVNSEKLINAIDFYTGQKVLDIQSQHERPVHTIIGNYGGIYTPRTSSTPDLAITGAFDNTVKLWDLRSARCERTFVSGSKTVKVGMCFSPDSKYVAVGTDRMGVEIWDVKQGTVIEKLKENVRGHTVTWLQWNPASGRLQCGLENGSIKIFS